MDALKEGTPEVKQPKLSWEIGTAYDLMMSLEINTSNINNNIEVAT